MPVTAVMAAPVTPVMTAAPVHVLGMRVRDIVLIRDSGLCGRIRLGPRTIHQIVLRGQHRRCARCRRSGCDRTCASGDAKRELEKITTFHQLFSLCRFTAPLSRKRDER